MDLEDLLKPVYINPKSILKVYVNNHGEKKLRSYLNWGYIISEDNRESIKSAADLESYDSGVKYKVVYQSYYKYATLRVKNGRKELLAPAAVYYRVFYPSSIASGKIDIAKSSKYVDTLEGLNLADKTSHFAGPCIITYIDKPKVAPPCATFKVNDILPRNLEGKIYLKEHYDNIYIYTKHKQDKVRSGERVLELLEESAS